MDGRSVGQGYIAAGNSWAAWFDRRGLIKEKMR
jgi:hypothetical protein